LYVRNEAFHLATSIAGVAVCLESPHRCVGGNRRIRFDHHLYPVLAVMTHRRPALFLLFLLVWWGCQEDPAIEGEWSGVTDTERGPGFYYKLSLDQVNEGIVGQGAISVYAQEGVAPESTFTVEVEGAYTHPNVMLTITGPIPTLSTRGAAEFSGFLTSDGNKIEGTLTSPALGTLNLDLERVLHE
jgi:hypothetical protein